MSEFTIHSKGFTHSDLASIHASNQTNPGLDSMESLYFCDSQHQLEPTAVGGKAAHLSHLQRIHGLAVPAWFVISTVVFQRFLVENGIQSIINNLDALCQDTTSNKEQIELLAKELQQQIVKATINENDTSVICHAISRLNIEKQGIAVRSSGVMEDSREASCAGLYSSILNCHGSQAILSAIKQVWASSFNTRVIQERIRLGMNQRDCKMGVIVQQLVTPSAAGVVTSAVLSNNYPGIEVAANYGFGESVVGGEVSVDGWVFHATKGYLLETTIGEKKHRLVANANSGLRREETAESNRKAQVLSPQQLIVLQAQVESIKKHFGYEVDVEFAFDTQGQLFILQYRPLVAVPMDSVQVVNPNAVVESTKIAHGHFSVPGVARGKLVYINSLEDLSSGRVKLSKGDIAVAHVTTNVWSQYLVNIGGIITREGSPSSHPILLSREKRIPCIVGVSTNFETLVALNGQTVTIDGFNRNVYQGEVQLKEATASDLLRQFEPIKLRNWPSLDEGLPHMLHNKMAVEHEGKYWRRTPTYPVSGFQQEINMRRFAVIPELLRKEVVVKAKVIDGYTCNELVPFADYVALFNDFSLEEAREFNHGHSQCIWEFEALAQKFLLTPDCWQRYMDTYTRLRAYIWLGGAFRGFSERRVDQLGIQLELPAYYLDACSQFLQDQIPEIDTKMHQAVYDLASRIKHIDLPEGIEELSQRHSNIFSELENLAKQFRFEHSISLDKSIDYSVVYQRIKQEVDSVRKGIVFASGKQVEKGRDYLSGVPELREWLRLSIENRLLQSDSHHIDARARSYVRPHLIDLGEKLVTLSVLKTPEDIFNLTSDQIANYITMLN